MSYSSHADQHSLREYSSFGAFQFVADRIGPTHWIEILALYGVEPVLARLVTFEMDEHQVVDNLPDMGSAQTVGSEDTDGFERLFAFQVVRRNLTLQEITRNGPVRLVPEKGYQA